MQLKDLQVAIPDGGDWAAFWRAAGSGDHAWAEIFAGSVIPVDFGEFVARVNYWRTQGSRLDWMVKVRQSRQGLAAPWVQLVYFAFDPSLPDPPPGDGSLEDGTRTEMSEVMSAVRATLADEDLAPEVKELAEAGYALLTSALNACAHAVEHHHNKSWTFCSFPVYEVARAAHGYLAALTEVEVMRWAQTHE